ncbi:MAG: cell division protein SepF, partial [Selenomonadaceae bacterium]|nr:cell division protein SepF [Selenomonadaceae bacterium]
DFALGTTYAIDGDVQQVNDSVFVCTPKTVMVIANKEEPKQERDFSWLTRKM